MSGGVLERAMVASGTLGLPRVWDVLRRGRVRVLMYHGVPAKERFEGVENYYRYNVPLPEFEQHMEYLASRCNVVSLGDFLEGRGLKAGRMNVVLTFDDGYRNNFTNALPVLERLGLPAVFAITSGFVTEREPLWNDQVEFAVRTTRRERVRLRHDGAQAEFDRASEGERLRLYTWLLRVCVQVPQLERPAVIEAAFQELGVAPEEVLSDPDYNPLTEEEVRLLGQSELVEVASHSVHHFLLGKLPPDRVRDEVRESRRVLEELAGVPVRAFCMPGGSFDGGVLEQIFAAGYEAVLTSEVGTVSPTQRVLKRCGIFSRDSIHPFVDLVHGPVQEVVEVAQRAKRSLGRTLGAKQNR